MDERQLGEVTGELRQIVSRLVNLETTQQQLRAENAQDHAAVVQQITTMGVGFKSELDKKADQRELDEVKEEFRASATQLRGWLFTLLIAVASSALVNFGLNFFLSRGR